MLSRLQPVYNFDIFSWTVWKACYNPVFFLSTDELPKTVQAQPELCLKQYKFCNLWRFTYTKCYKCQETRIWILSCLINYLWSSLHPLFYQFQGDIKVFAQWYVKIKVKLSLFINAMLRFKFYIEYFSPRTFRPFANHLCALVIFLFVNLKLYKTP